MQKLLRAGFGTLAAFALAGVGVAAAATPTGGPIQLSASVDNGPTEKIVFAGAIGDWGHIQTVDKNGKPNENGHFEKATLKKGTFVIDATALDKNWAGLRPQVANDATCSAGIANTASVKLFNGTGLYKGISGTVKVTVTFTGLGGRYQTGAKKGQCDQDSQGASLGSVSGRGSVQFG
jgi:hypothetical protein